nr:retrovirus-related Pol polyprotein from transposon TNT 1-94 [Tanacetum cinerariifolium]
MYKLDRVTLAPQDKNNRETHIYYLKYTMEQAAIFREIVEQAKSLNPLDNTSYSACKYVKLIQELLGYVRDTCPNIYKPNKKLVAVMTINKKKTIRIIATNKVPLREPIPIEGVAQESVVTKVYTRRPKVPKTTGSISKPKIAKSMISTKTEPDTSRGSRHNLFSVGQFCDSNLEIAFRKHMCFVPNMEGDDLLLGSRETNLYTFSMGGMMASSPICLLSKALKTKSWLWHRRLSHLNFGAINHLAKNGLVRGLSKLKFKKDHLCLACAMGRSKKQSHKPKSEDTNKETLYLLHMDLCGPMPSKDEAPDFIIKFLKMIQVRLNTSIRNIRTNNGTEFVNQTLRSYYESIGISHETSIVRYPQQNGVIERQNCTLVEAAQTMLICAKAPLVYEPRQSLSHVTPKTILLYRAAMEKNPYELLHDRKPHLSYLHVFGALCYPNNDSEDLGKLHAKADIVILIGYVPKNKAYRIYN